MNKIKCSSMVITLLPLSNLNSVFSDVIKPVLCNMFWEGSMLHFMQCSN